MKIISSGKPVAYFYDSAHRSLQMSFWEEGEAAIKARLIKIETEEMFSGCY